MHGETFDIHRSSNSDGFDPLAISQLYLSLEICAKSQAHCSLSPDGVMISCCIGDPQFSSCPVLTLTLGPAIPNSNAQVKMCHVDLKEKQGRISGTLALKGMHLFQRRQWKIDSNRHIPTMICTG